MEVMQRAVSSGGTSTDVDDERAQTNDVPRGLRNASDDAEKAEMSPDDAATPRNSVGSVSCNSTWRVAPLPDTVDCSRMP